jgi:hypothetical protein
VRLRFGEKIDHAVRTELAAGFARGIGREIVLVPTSGGFDEADDDQLESLARGLVDEAAWKSLLGGNLTDGRLLSEWMVRRLDAAAIGRAFAAMPEATVKNLMVETIEALLDHADGAEAFTAAIEAIPAEAKLHRTVLAIVAGAKRAAAGLPIPRPWPTLRSYADMVHGDVRRVLVRALTVLFGAFDEARVRSFVETRLSAGMTADALVALSVKPDKALVKRALAAAALDAYPEAHGALLSALGKTLPKQPYQLRLDTLVARCAATAPSKRDPRWLDALELGASLGDDTFTPMWCETEILLGFPETTRAELVLAAVAHEGSEANHAISSFACSTTRTPSKR